MFLLVAAIDGWFWFGGSYSSQLAALGWHKSAHKAEVTGLALLYAVGRMKASWFRKAVARQRRQIFTQVARHALRYQVTSLPKAPGKGWQLPGVHPQRRKGAYKVRKIQRNISFVKNTVFQNFFCLNIRVRYYRYFLDSLFSFISASLAFIISYFSVF